MHAFCLDQTGRILAGVGQKEGELRVFDPEGKFLAAWKLPVQPEAVNVGSDGLVYVAGGGQLLKLDCEGKLLLQKESPHAVAIKANSSKLREDVIAQAKERTEAFAQAIKSYEQQIERVKTQIEKLSARATSSPRIRSNRSTPRRKTTPNRRRSPRNSQLRSSSNSPARNARWKPWKNRWRHSSSTRNRCRPR